MWNDAAYNSTKGMTLGWSYCWDSPWVSKANGSVLNATSVADYFERQAAGQYVAGERPGAGLDECIGANVKGEKEAAGKYAPVRSVEGRRNPAAIACVIFR